MPNKATRSNTVLHAVLDPQVVNDTPIPSKSIIRPWEKSRKLAVMTSFGAFASGDIITGTWQMRRVGTSTWDSILDKDGNALTFVVIDADTAENGVIMAEIDLVHLDHGAFERDAVRVSYVNTVSADVLTSAVGIGSDLINLPDPTTVAAEATYTNQRDFDGPTL